MAPHWQATNALSRHQRLDVLNLLNYLEAHLGREALDESRRRVVVHSSPAQHWLQYRSDVLIGYAMIAGTSTPSLEMAGGGFDETLLTHVLTHYPRIDWWTRGTQEHLPGRELRTLRFLRIRLPVQVADVPAGAHLRTFDPARDEHHWLEQNNAAFADHPEQGAWSLQDLDARAHEPWFDPSGFLILEMDGNVVASCWTKIHEHYQERFGEIYAISVHPSVQGHGLGRVMLTQGLEALRLRGVSVAGLFVDESNTAANALYSSLGFELVREDHLTRFERSAVSAPGS